MKLRELFEKTKAVLVEHGWIRGQMKSPEGFCLVGAIEEVYPAPTMHLDRTGSDGPVRNPEYGKWCEQRQEIFRILRAAGADQWGSITNWNDASYRTKEEVLAKLDQAAEAAGDAELEEVVR